MISTKVVMFFITIIATGCSVIALDEKQSRGIRDLLHEKQTRQQKEPKLQQNEIELLTEEVNSLKAELNAVKKSLLELEKPSEGVSYIRWGRTTCPSGSASLVYKGYMGGSPPDRSLGGGVDYLCLPDEPQWGNTQDGLQYMARMFGVEYRTWDAEKIFSKVNNGGRSLTYYDAVCVACFVPTRSTQIMIPAKRTCPVGWTMEYRGYLVTQHSEFGRMQFICMDEEPESRPGSSAANEEAARIHAVEGFCGTLPCGPYVHGWELACVVCTK